MLDKSGATLKEAMRLARHSDPNLTLAVCGRAQLHDLGEAVRRLPSLLADSETQIMLATGTDSACIVDCTNLAHTADSRCDAMITHARLLRRWLLPFVLENPRRRRQQLLPPAVKLRRVDPLPTA